MSGFIPQTPPRASDPVTIAYIYNHLFQVLSWIKYLEGQHEEVDDELRRAHDFVKRAQEQVGIAVKDKREE